MEDRIRHRFAPGQDFDDVEKYVQKVQAVDEHKAVKTGVYHRPDTFQCLEGKDGWVYMCYLDCRGGFEFWFGFVYFVFVYLRLTLVFIYLLCTPV